MEKRKILLGQRIKTDLVTGMIVLIPSTLALYILFLLLRFFAGLVAFFSPFKFIKSEISLGINVVSGLVILLLLLILIGELTEHFLGRRLVFLWENWLKRLPLGGPIYTLFKQITRKVLVPERTSFRKVVLVPFPHPGVLSVGFITEETSYLMEQESEKNLHIFIPTAPNPTTGFFIIVPKEKVRELPLTVEEAFALILSGGMFQKEEKKEEEQVRQ